MHSVTSPAIALAVADVWKTLGMPWLRFGKKAERRANCLRCRACVWPADLRAAFALHCASPIHSLDC